MLVLKMEVTMLHNIVHLNLQYILDMAEKFEKEGKKDKAKQWLQYAERYEGIMKRFKKVETDIG